MSAPILTGSSHLAPRQQNIIQSDRQRELQSIRACEKAARVAGLIIMGIGLIGVVVVPTVAKVVLEDNYMLVAFPGGLLSLGVAALGLTLASNPCSSNESVGRDFYVV